MIKITTHFLGLLIVIIKNVIGAVLENLSAGRMGICQESTNRISAAAIIAIRYAAVRKQFSTAPSLGKEETPILEYELHVSFSTLTFSLLIMLLKGLYL